MLDCLLSAKVEQKLSRYPEDVPMLNHIIILPPTALIKHRWFSPSNSSMWKKQVLIDERTPSVNQDRGARQEGEKNPRWRHSFFRTSDTNEYYQILDAYLLKSSRIFWNRHRHKHLQSLGPLFREGFAYTSSLASAFLLSLVDSSFMSRHQEKAMRPEYSSDNNSCQVLVMDIMTGSIDPA